MLITYHSCKMSAFASHVTSSVVVNLVPFAHKRPSDRCFCPNNWGLLPVCTMSLISKKENQFIVDFPGYLQHPNITALVDCT